MRGAARGAQRLARLSGWPPASSDRNEVRGAGAGHHWHMRIRRIRHRREPHEGGERADHDVEYVELDPGELSGVFAPPGWLRDLGILAWLLVGVTGMLVGAVWLLVAHADDRHPRRHGGDPGLGAGARRAVARKRAESPRGAGAGIVLLAVVVAGAAIVALVLGGISAQAGEIESQLKTRGEQDRGRAQGPRVARRRRPTRRATRADRSAARSTPCSGESERACEAWPRSRCSSRSPS